MILKIDKMDFKKFKKFCTSNQTIKKVKRKTTKWERIFVNHIG